MDFIELDRIVIEHIHNFIKLDDFRILHCVYYYLFFLLLLFTHSGWLGCWGTWQKIYTYFIRRHPQHHSLSIAGKILCVQRHVSLQINIFYFFFAIEMFHRRDVMLNIKMIEVCVRFFLFSPNFYLPGGNYAKKILYFFAFKFLIKVTIIVSFQRSHFWKKSIFIMKYPITTFHHQYNSLFLVLIWHKA